MSDRFLYMRMSSLAVFLSLALSSALAQDTFSIVAIDSVTGQIGSAGASCVGSSGSYPHGAQILSDVIPGIGVIHTQASWTSTNQQHAHNWMIQGLSPQQIIDSLVANDAGSNATIRQYGIADYNGGHPRSASFTGINCLDYKNDTNHIYYSIQGNILMGQQILDSMQQRFLNTPGPLSDRLMAALQGAKVIGADTRCAPKNSSSQSSFIRVANLNNLPDSLYLDLWMAYPTNYSGAFPVDPIDSLQTLYDIWKITLSARGPEKEWSNKIKAFGTADGSVVFDFTLCRDYKNALLQIFDILGKTVASVTVVSRVMRIDLPGNNSGQVLLYRLVKQDHSVVATGKFLY
ncbi:MAG: DUF1028 domain-containing protein [Bacteroidetes bacterium]|nr:DUF1028 domain-containing protein [Bacteroidota bacterium]